jgi:sugar phosphate isomerase/epimerase
MAFNTEYYSTLDRGFYHQDPQKPFADVEEISFPESTEQGTQLTMREIGTTADANVYPLQALQAKIREGVGRVEMTFLGTGKGGFGGQQATPEILGKLEREQLRELAKINEVKVSTHASPGFQGLSGFDPRSGRFDDEAIQQNIKEIDKAIDFAAHASTGGAVVFHTGEWQRPLMEAGLTDKEKREGKRQGLFQEYETEPKKAPIYLADAETGRIAGIQRDMKFYFPDEEYDPKTKLSYVKKNPDGTPKVNEYNFEGALKHLKKIHKDDGTLLNKNGMMKTDGEILLYGLYEQQLKGARGDTMRFFSDVEHQKDALKKIVEAKEFVKRYWDATPENERWKLMERVNPLGDSALGKYVRADSKNPLELLEEQERRMKSQVEGYQSTAISQQERYEQILKETQRMKPIEEVGIERTAKAIANVGIKAMRATDKNRKDLDEPIYVAPEGYMPQFYGSHPDEIRTIVQKSRSAMAQQLVKEGYSESSAREKAKTHIRATVDTGHLNMWRQHFMAKEGESPEQREDRFKTWYLSTTKKLAEDGVIGQIHLSDNWGYDDEHLTAGQGNAPIKDFVKNMEKSGIKTYIAERGSFNAQTILPDTLRELGSPVYALGRRINFSNVRHGHFGYNAPANYIVGAYAPSNEWRLWSEVPLE